MRFQDCWIVCLLLLFVKSFILKYALAANCDEGLLGVEELSDLAFTATSNSEVTEQSIAGLSSGVDHSAKTARDMLTGGWCPSRKVSTNLTEYIQVDMQAVNVITKIALGPRSNVAYTPTFVIRYKRESSADWRYYKSCSSNSTLIIPGMESNFDLKLIPLNPPIIARWVRVYPYSQKPMFVCAKFEFYGCRSSDELVEYKIPDGSEFHLNSFSNPLNLHDTCYDGQRDSRGGVLHGGVGCLTDSRITTLIKAFQLAPWHLDSSSSVSSVTAAASTTDCLVGWNRSRWEETQRSASPAVDLLFRFAGLRVFKELYLHALNMPSRKIQMPRRVEASFSVDGSIFPATPDVFLDIHSFSNEPLIIDLKGKMGQAVQLKVFFANEWIVLSETRFISDTGKGHGSPNRQTNESEKPPPSSLLIVKTPNLPAMDKVKVIDDRGGSRNAEAVNIDVEDKTFQNLLISEASGGPLRVIDRQPYQGPTMLVLILVFLCCFMLLLVGVACFSMAWMQKKRKKREQGLRSEHHHSTNGKLSKMHPGSVGLFRWPGLSFTTSGGNIPSQASFDGGLGYVTMPSADADLCNGAVLACNGVPPHATDQNGGDGRPIAKRLLNSLATRLFRSRCTGKVSGAGVVRILSPSSAHQYEQVLVPSAPSSPALTSSAAVFQSQLLAPSRNETSVPTFPVTSLPVHTANGLIQIDLKRSHPSLILNGRPLLQFQQQTQQQPGPDNNNIRGTNYFPNFSNCQHDSSVVYQSVHGESDADSLAASTMSPEYASASLLGGQSGSGLPFIGGIGGWAPGDYSTVHRQLVDAAAANQAMMQQPYFASPPVLKQEQQQTTTTATTSTSVNAAAAAAASAAAAAAYAWTSPTGAYIQRSFSQQQFHQPFWTLQSVGQAAPVSHEVTSSAHSGESSDQFSAQIAGVISSSSSGGGCGGGGGGSAGDPSSTIYGFTGQS